MSTSQKDNYDGRSKRVGDRRQPLPPAAIESEGNDNPHVSSMRKQVQQHQIETKRVLQEQINNLKHIIWESDAQYKKNKELLEQLERDAQNLTRLDVLALLSKVEQQTIAQQPNKRRRTSSNLLVHGKQFVAPNKL